MLRALLFVPLVVYLLLGVVLVVRQSMGYDPDTLRIVTSGAASFALYYYVCVAILSAFRLSLPRFALGGLAGPVALFLILAALDLRGGERGGSGAFINLDITFKSMWLLPGMFLTPRVRPLTSPFPPIVQIRGALTGPDRSLIFAGTVFRHGLTTDWTLFNSSAPKSIVLPDLTLLRSQQDGSALISWRDGSTNKLGTLTADGAITSLFDLVPSTGEIFSAEPLTDAARDTAGRLVIAAVFEKPSPEGTGYAQINYPVARFDAAGHLDPTFSLLAVPRFLKSGAVRIAGDGGMLVTYEELGGAPRLRLLLQDGRPDSRFELGLAKTLAELDHGPVRAADLDRDGHVLIVLREQPLDELLLVRLDADGRPIASAVIPGNMGEVGNVTSQADGSALVIMGNKKVGPTEFTWPWYPTLLRFHPDLRPDEAFDANVAALGREFGEMSILESRPDGSVVVSLNHSQRGSCVYYLGPEGSVEKRIPF